MNFRKCLKHTAGSLVIIGGLNWGLIGFFDFNLVTFLFQNVAIIEKIIYCVVGLAALWRIFLLAIKCTSGCNMPD